MQVDAIVNAASRYPRVNAGVDSAIHKKAGPALLEARKETGYIQPGGAAITPAFNLDAENVIHAATPTCTDGLRVESQLLLQAYFMCLDLAVKNNCDSIAFPLLASGPCFPKQRLCRFQLPLSVTSLTHEMQIYCSIARELKLSEKLVQNVRSFIDEN